MPYRILVSSQSFSKFYLNKMLVTRSMNNSAASHSLHDASCKKYARKDRSIAIFRVTITLVEEFFHMKQAPLTMIYFYDLFEIYLVAPKLK